MPIASVPQLVDLVRQFRLLDAERLSELTRDLQPRFPSPQALAKELVQRGWLTAFQVNRLFQGKAQELVLGSYILLEPIGEGGMGTVFRARHQLLDRVDAIKVIRSVYMANPKAVQRFHREAKAAARLSHPNVITVYDAGQSGDIHFLAMEFVAGIDLSRLVKQRGPLPTAQACDYIRQAALGLQHAHEKGLIHRDVKPSNLLLSSDGTRVKVLDLGLARPIDAGQLDHSLTSSEVMVGTADYVAPEQARNSKQIDSRADLYSLGCSLYVLLTGKIPFPGETVTEKLLKHQLEEPASVESLRQDLPAGLGDLVRRMMAKRPEDRFGSPAEVAVALAPFAQETLVREALGSASIPVAYPVASGDLPAEVGTAATVRLGLTETPAAALAVRRRRWLLAAIAGAVLLAGLGVTAVILAGRRVEPVAGRTEQTGPTRLDPKGAKAHLDRGDELLNARQWDGAIAAFTEALRFDPSLAAAYHQRGKAYTGKKDFDRAIADYSQAIDREPKRTEAYFDRAYAYFQKRDFDKCLADNTRVIELQPTSASAYSNRGTIYAHLMAHDKAIGDFTAALKIDPEHVSALQNRGNAYIATSQYDLALADFTRAIEAAPAKSESLSFRGYVYFIKNDFAAALKDQDLAIKLDPKLGVAYYRRAEVHQKLGNQAKADADRKLALKLDPSLGP